MTFAFANLRRLIERIIEFFASAFPINWVHFSVVALMVSLVGSGVDLSILLHRNLSERAITNLASLLMEFSVLVTGATVILGCALITWTIDVIKNAIGRGK